MGFKVKREERAGFSTDLLMRKLYANLYSDFKPYLEATEDHDSINLIRSDMTEFRNHRFDRKRMYRKVSTFKRSYQLETLFKRYRFRHDKFTTPQLDELTNKKFIDTQLRIATPRDLKYRSLVVLKAAAKHVRRILGRYSESEHMAGCRFGTRAAVGHPSSKRYLDLKASGPVTGSREHIAWFKNQLELEENYLLRDMLVESCPSKDLADRYVLCDTLKLTNVPKTFKAFRCIMANTLIGGFYSYGLGKVIQHRLVSEGLNIRYLQQRHRTLVIPMSANRRLVTADLSAASDSFTPQLVCRLLPREWWAALNRGRIRYVEIESKRFSLTSFMTMGIGFTFQLQTLLFYSLLRGIEDCLGKKGFVSVYGDDLIYSKQIHPYVETIFKDLGFLLNEDKTFVEESFRESCGADAYCGFDVRPFQPEGQSQSLSRGKYVCFLYKTINGLKERWKTFEIYKTLNFLYSEILSIDTSLLQVPVNFPAYAGVRTPSIVGFEPWVSPIWSIPTIGGRYQNLCFFVYKQNPETRPVKGMYIYYWDKLRVSSTSFGFDNFEPYGTHETLIWKDVRIKTRALDQRGHFIIKHKLKAHVSTDRYNVIRQSTTVHAWSDGSLS